MSSRNTQNGHGQEQLDKKKEATKTKWYCPGCEMSTQWMRIRRSTETCKQCWMLKYQQEQHAQRMEAEQAQRAFELEIENRKVAQEESKLKQEKIKARTNEVQKAQQIDIERLKVQQEEERKKVQLEHTKVRMKEIELEALKERNATLLREKATDLEHYKEENKREAMAFELQRARNEQIEMLAGCDLQKLQVIKQILQIQNQPNDESGSIDGSQQAIISQNRQLRALLSY